MFRYHSTFFRRGNGTCHILNLMFTIDCKNLNSCYINLNNLNRNKKNIYFQTLPHLI